MLLAQTRRLAIPVILTGLMACDNVSWGGVELHLEAPPATDTAVVDSTGAPQAEPTLPPLDLDRSLFVLDRSPASGSPTPRLLPVALFGDEGLEPFPAPGEIERLGERFIRERMPPDRRFVLYAGGARVGSFFPDSTRAQPTFGALPPQTGDGPSDESADLRATSLCTPRPAVGGWLEILPDAAEEEYFLALPAESAPPSPPGAFRPRSADAELLDASLSVASALYVTREILWPPSVQAARRAMDVVQLPGESDELIVATFLYGDSLAVGPAPPNAYSLFFIAGPGTVRPYEADYVRYRVVGSDGKSAPRFLQHFDWDDDGGEDVLLEIFGQGGRSFGALSRTEDGWEQVFEEGTCDIAPRVAAIRDGSAESATSTPAP